MDNDSENWVTNEIGIIQLIIGTRVFAMPCHAMPGGVRAYLRSQSINYCIYLFRPIDPFLLYPGIKTPVPRIGTVRALYQFASYIPYILPASLTLTLYPGVTPSPSISIPGRSPPPYPPPPPVGGSIHLSQPSDHPPFPSRAGVHVGNQPTEPSIDQSSQDAMGGDTTRGREWVLGWAGEYCGISIPPSEMESIAGVRRRGGGGGGLLLRFCRVVVIALHCVDCTPRDQIRLLLPVYIKHHSAHRTTASAREKSILDGIDK